MKTKALEIGIATIALFVLAVGLTSIPAAASVPTPVTASVPSTHAQQVVQSQPDSQVPEVPACGPDWAAVDSPSPGASYSSLSAVSAVSSSDVWAVGYDYSDTPPTATSTNTPCPFGSRYIITQSTGATIVPGTTDTGNHCDDCATNIVLPFAYTLYDMSYLSVVVDSNGTLQFHSNASISTNVCLPEQWTGATI